MISIECYQAIAAVCLSNLHLSTVRRAIATIWLVAITTAIIPIMYAELNLYYPYECGMGIISRFQILIILLVSFVIISILPRGIMLIVITFRIDITKW